MAAVDHNQLLNQLQSEVNEVWKQIGRLFAAVRVNENASVLPIGHVVKLKKMLPRSDERFQAALDALEDELQIAKLVLRRDLAVCRERAGLQVPLMANAAPVSTSIDMPDAAELENAPAEASNGASPTENVTLKNSEPTEQSEATLSAVGNEETTQHESNTAEEAPVTEDLVLTDSDPKPETSETAEAAPGRTLHIDTQAQIPQKSDAEDTAGDEDKPPDTANFSTTNDLDSLFGGPLSAGAGESATFTMDPNTTSEFDFDAFTAGLDSNAAVDNDNISSLLPGLEDYATEPAAEGEEINFDDFFATAGNEGEGGHQPNIPHRDSTFDGLHDLADFNVDEFTGGGGGNVDGQDFEFDFLKD